MWDSKTFLRTYLNFILILQNKFYFKTRIWLQDKAKKPDLGGNEKSFKFQAHKF